MAEVALTIWLVTVFVIACYGVHLGISNQIELKAQKLSTHKIEFVPLDLDSKAASAEEAALNKDLEDIEDDQIDHMGSTMFKQGPLI